MHLHYFVQLSTRKWPNGTSEVRTSLPMTMIPATARGPLDPWYTRFIKHMPLSTWPTWGCDAFSDNLCKDVTTHVHCQHVIWYADKLLRQQCNFLNPRSSQYHEDWQVAQAAILISWILDPLNTVWGLIGHYGDHGYTVIWPTNFNWPKGHPRWGKLICDGGSCQSERSLRSLVDSLHNSQLMSTYRMICWQATQVVSISYPLCLEGW